MKSCPSSFHTSSINYLTVLIIALISVSYSNAQEIYTPPDSIKLMLAYKRVESSFHSPISFEDLAPDSIPRPKIKLLPSNISFMENELWGENGLVRQIGLASPLTPQVRKHELEVRRTMLTAHLIGGITTFALMATTDYFGQRVIDGRRDLGDTHQAFVAATIISYSVTALLAVLAPPPLIRRDNETSTTTIHKTLAWIHAAGMIATPILGSMIGGRRHFNISKAHFHQIAGYITTTVFAAAMLSLIF